MKIQNNKVIFEYEMNNQEWWLLCEKGTPGNCEDGIWWLARKIDRSYKGKEPDVAVPDVQISSEEANELQKAFNLDRIWD